MELFYWMVMKTRSDGSKVRQVYEELGVQRSSKKPFDISWLRAGVDARLDAWLFSSASALRAEISAVSVATTEATNENRGEDFSPPRLRSKIPFEGNFE